MKLKLLTAAMLAMAIAPMQANALTTTGNIKVSATIITATAKILVAGSLAFGNVLQRTSGSSATTTFDITVTKGTPYTIDFGGGLNSPTAQFFVMKDTGGANTLNYNLYKDGTKTVKYLANRLAPVITGQSGTGLAQTHTLFATTSLAGAAGNYADTITITVAY